MTILNKLFSSLNIDFKFLKTKYFNTKIKIFEFILVEALYILMSVLLMLPASDQSFKQILGQFQIFAAIYLAFRFRFFGLFIGLFINLFEIVLLSYAYMAHPMIGILAGFTSKVLTILSSIVMAILSNKQEKQKEELQEQKSKLETLSVTDDLTGAYNHRFFNSTLDNEIEKLKLTRDCIALIMIDIDNFKMCNDISGHDYGDDILKGTASILKEAAGDGNTVCRYGGDEFAIILPSSNLQSASQIAHRIRNLFEKQKTNYFEENSYSNITLSMGLSVYPDMADNKDELINQADMALYHSKNLGKDNIHFYQDILVKLKKNISSDHQHMIGVFKALLSTISAKDMYTRGHSERVAHYAVKIGEALNLNLKDISMLQYAGLLHDIGKVEIPKVILSKKEKLTDAEQEIIKQHPLYSANILEPLNMNQLIDYVIHHHERYDGHGYPHGLAGKSISLGARILCVADCFDAILSERPYSSSMNMNEAFLELEHHSGSQFDPEIVNILINVMKNSEEYKKAI
ncbi:bifunctional diguanylate cyclase/phosphohydrolase [Acetivibrio cellulolyticus]|uniref:bifunctional diguanylate cyclase/phosphohydrolase n=1 Tax=Acetivibrio cellulolyticus TaxID=35830 RepID=UPI0001E2D422|nr:diguanylate cyclase [Acetivibrio cellulolyticus]